MTINAVMGVASFSNSNGINNSLTIDTVGTYQIKATSTGLTSVISTSITVTPAAAEQLVWTTPPPSEATEGVGFGATSR